LGCALLAKRELDGAIAAFQDAVRLKDDDPEFHCNLGHSLRDKGLFVEALTHLRRGHDLGSRNPRWRYPSAAWVQDCERLVELDAKRPGVLRGEIQPANAAEGIALAEMCLRCKKLYTAAPRFYAGAFASQPELAKDLNRHHRYEAARAAALAGCRQ